VTLATNQELTLKQLIEIFEMRVPKEYHETAVIKTGVAHEYGDDYGYIEASYLRPETDEECARRKRIKEQQELNERMLYERLRLKYGKQ
jgi:hypothetical protein